jgi:hypothetical protein|tara:strand:- start:313 stop:648 length:336 start_codon:yes stop_codon:yes gene_type:complete
MFASSHNKGFSITFENGNTVSVQWGPGNYCDPEHEMGRNAHPQAPSRTQVWKSATAEVAAWNADGDWHNFECDQVDGWQSADDVAKFISFVSSNKLNTEKIPWMDDEDEDE